MAKKIIPKMGHEKKALFILCSSFSSWRVVWWQGTGSFSAPEV
jgi:hypothetical protein